MQEDRFPGHAIAIVGMAGRFPDADTLDQFWQNIRDGVESLEHLSEQDLSAAGVPSSISQQPNYVAKGTYLKESAMFDAEFFGISPAEAEIIDPQQRLFLECAWQALEHAGYAPDGIDVPVNLYAGTSMNTYFLSSIMANRSKAEAAGGYQLMLGNDKDFLCTRASYKLNLTGASMTVQTACSTSLVAVEMACRALARGECDLALAGGTSITYPERTGYLYQEGMIFSPDGHCRPFDAQAKGTRAGAGAGIVTLKRLSDAIADRDTIHAVIRGAAVNNDGADKAGYTAPSIDGQVEAIVMAQKMAGVSPDTIGYIEAHGTGTPLGDPIEVAALTRAFRDETNRIGYCRLGSLKANIGHLDAAAGVAGLMKAVLCLKHGVLPPLVNFETANPKLDLDSSPFVASNRAADWAPGDHPRRAGVSSFGIGGTNAHVVLEEAPVYQHEAPAKAEQLLVLSARNTDALTQAASELADALDQPDCAPLSDVRHTLQTGRSAHEVRRHVVASDPAQAAQLLRRKVRGVRHQGGDRQISFMFSGQGSQHAGMGAQLYDSEPAYRSALDRCAEILRPTLDLDLVSALRPGASSDLNQTWLTQPGLFAVEYALATLWQSRGFKPVSMIGHSIGEYVAAHLSGVMSLEDALALVAERGRLMQSMQPGSMAAVDMPAGRLRDRLGEEVDFAAENSDDLTVISGETDAVQRIVSTLGEDGISCRLLHTSHAFHSRMMEPILDEFKDVVAKVTLNTPEIPYVSNVTGDWITDAQAVSPDYYAQHLRGTVRFAAGLRCLAQDDALFLLEVGPGVTLANLARMTLPGWQDRVASSQAHPKDDTSQQAALLDATGRMWGAGVTVDWCAQDRNEERRRVPLPTYPFQRKRYWIEPDTAQPDAAAGSSQTDRPAIYRTCVAAPSWVMSPTSATLRQHDGNWIVLADDPDFASAVSRSLSDAGLAPEAIFTLPIKSWAEEYAAVSQTPVNTVIVAPNPDTGTARLFDTVREIGLTAEGMGGGQAVRLVVQTTGACSVCGEAVVAPDHGIIAGQILALNAESEKVHARQVDLDPSRPETAARDLALESLRFEPELVSALRNGMRWHRTYTEVDLDTASGPEQTPLRDKGTYLITGGLGGVGLTLARELAERVNARLVLTSRTPLPDRESWQAEIENGHPKADTLRRLTELEDLGAQVMVAPLDAADVPGLRSLADRVSATFGTLDGIIHAAGVVGANTLAALLQPDSFDQAFAPKAQGLRALAEVFGNTELDFVALLGSINSIVPAAGAMDYAAANAFLDVWPDSAERPQAWRKVVTFNWGGWAKVGMAARMRDGDADLLDPDIAVRLFLDGLSSGAPRLVVTNYDLAETFLTVKNVLRARLHGQFVDSGPDDIAATADAAAGSGLLDETLFETEAQKTIAAIWVELLGVELCSPDDDFFELGGHSLMATRLISRLDAIMTVKLTLRDVFDKPTIREMAEHVAGPLSSDDGDDDAMEEIVI